MLTFIQRIILVGGFAESSYLYKAIANWCQNNGDIKLMRPEYPYVLHLYIELCIRLADFLFPTGNRPLFEARPFVASRA